MERSYSETKHPLDTSPQRRFLERFETNRRGFISNIFLRVTRQGVTNPNVIVSTVRRNLVDQSKRATYWNPDSNTIQRNDAILDVLNTHHEEAVDFAKWAVEWESLSDSERQAIKAERGAYYKRQHMDSQPPTDKQVRYVRALGYDGTIESKLHASELIDKLRNDKGDGHGRKWV